MIHLGHRGRGGDPLDHFFTEKNNVEMVYNILRTSYDAGVPRVAIASSNHAADWYEHALIHRRKMETLDPFRLPLSDNFYGWAKASYEHMGFLFACGSMGFRDASGREQHTGGLLDTSPKMGVVYVRIGAPRDLDLDLYDGDPEWYKRDLGAYISPRDITQLFTRAIEAPNIENEDGVPWQVVYGISNNTRAFWSLVQRTRGPRLRAPGRLRGQVRRRHPGISRRLERHRRPRPGGLAPLPEAATSIAWDHPAGLPNRPRVPTDSMPVGVEVFHLAEGVLAPKVTSPLCGKRSSSAAPAGWSDNVYAHRQYP